MVDFLYGLAVDVPLVDSPTELTGPFISASNHDKPMSTG